jgi:hypothetical protein
MVSTVLRTVVRYHRLRTGTARGGAGQRVCVKYAAPATLSLPPPAPGAPPGASEQGRLVSPSASAEEG